MSMEELHMRLRRILLAGPNMEVATKNYREFPNDLNALQLLRAWKEMVEARQWLTSLPDPELESMARAVRRENKTKRKRRA